MNGEFFGYIILMIPAYYILTFWIPAIFIYGRKDLTKQEKEEKSIFFIGSMKFCFIIMFIIFIANLFGYND